MAANPRAAAVAALVRQEQDGFSNLVLDAELRRQKLEGRDKAFAGAIFYTVLEHQGTLDFILEQFLPKGLARLDPQVREILRAALAQARYMQVPVSAAVNEAVKLTRAFKKSSASGLVNAVLRKVAQNKSNLPPLPEGNIARLSVAYSHPQWLVKKLVSLLGVEEAEAFLRIDNEASPISVQVNPLKTNEKALADELRGEGVCVTPHPWVPGCLELSGTGDLTTLSAFYNGRFTVQDAAAHLIVCAADFARGQRVLDVCAAPGGKSFAAAFAMENEGSILSCDLHENKLKRIREGAQRLGITCIETAAVDGRAFRKEWAGKFDVVICDVPCSGLGIIRKKPDIRYKDVQEFSALPEIQRAILENSARYVKRGGLLVYST